MVANKASKVNFIGLFVDVCDEPPKFLISFGPVILT